MVEVKSTNRSFYHLKPGATGIDRRLQSTRDEMVTRCILSRDSILAVVKEDCAGDTWMEKVIGPSYINAGFSS